MQFTGLHDKNGKEIYEGDILKRICKHDKCKGDIKFNAVEYFSGGTLCGYRIRNKSYHEPLARNRIINGDMEVIGNIHQDSHLLKEKQR